MKNRTSFVFAGKYCYFFQPGFETPNIRLASSRSNFTAQLQQARMAPQAQDTASLSSLSYQRRDASGPVWNALGDDMAVLSCSIL